MTATPSEPGEKIEWHFDDPDMHARVIAVVERAIADAVPPRPFRHVIDGKERLNCGWTARKSGAPVVAERWELRRGFAYHLQVRNPDNPTDSYTMTELQVRTDLTQAKDTVCWWPGLGEVSKEQFLAWWEGIVDPEAWARYERDYPKDEHGSRVSGYDVREQVQD